MGRSFINTRKSNAERYGPLWYSMRESLRRRLYTSADNRTLPAVVKEGAYKAQAAFIKTIDTHAAFQSGCRGLPDRMLFDASSSRGIQSKIHLKSKC